jgi:hypothetical protein
MDEHRESIQANKPVLPGERPSGLPSVEADLGVNPGVKKNSRFRCIKRERPCQSTRRAEPFVS